MRAKSTKDVGTIKSIKMKVVGVTVLAILLVSAVTLGVMIPVIQSNVSKLAEDSIYNLALSYGKNLDVAVGFDEDGESRFLSEEFLTQQYAELEIRGYSSAYIYVVAKDGTMLYHPTTEKIGQPVENEVIKSVVEELQSGSIPDPEEVTYQYKGEKKYAGYYVGKSGDFILVVTDGEKDMMGIVNTIWRKTMMGSIFATLFACIISFIIIRFIISPIKKLNKSIQKIQELDFTTDAEHEKLNRRKDEIGSISRAVTAMREKLFTMIQSIQQQSVILHDAAGKLSENAVKTENTIEQIDQAVHEIAESANAQAEETQTATENVVLIGDMIGTSTKNLEELSENVSRMKQASYEAAAALKQLDSINQEAKESIQIISKQTNTTNQSAVKIQEATSLITSIAEETNLLSLNASIEAARAGENGRGFAVVAAQIQKLAEQSNESAQKIEKIITSLIGDSEKAVETMDAVRDIMNAQSENVEKTVEIFEEVNNEIENSILGIQNITKEAKKIDGVREDVVDVVQNLTAIAQENSATTEETSASVSEVGTIVSDIAENAEKLKQIAEELEEHMQVFQL